MSVTTSSIRRAGPDDRDAVVGLHTRSWQSAYADTLDANWLADGCRAHMEAKWTPRLADPEVFTVELIEGPSGVLGFSCVEVIPDTRPFLDNLHVAPDTRRTGVGSTLMASIFERLRREDNSVFELDVFEHNDAARAFYERWGGHVASTFDEHGPEGSVIPSVRYRFELS